MKNEYLELKEKHQKEINDFPMFFAFNKKQVKEGLKKLNATTKEICSISAGGFIRKTDSKKLEQMFLNHEIARKQAIADDLTGEGYIASMFQYELDNHEYNYTLDASNTLEALGLTREEVLNNPALLNGFRLAGGTYL